MKKSTKILLCLSAVLIAFGTLLAAASFIFLGADPVGAFQSKMFVFTIQQKRTSEFSLDGRYSIPANGLEGLSIDWIDVVFLFISFLQTFLNFFFYAF